MAELKWFHSEQANTHHWDSTIVIVLALSHINPSIQPILFLDELLGFWEQDYVWWKILAGPIRVASQKCWLMECMNKSLKTTNL